MDSDIVAQGTKDRNMQRAFDAILLLTVLDTLRSEVAHLH